VPFIDTTGEFNLAGIVKQFKDSGGSVLISGIQRQPKEVLQKTGLYDFIGKDHFFEHTGDAINYALTRINISKCWGCRHFAFRECATLSQPPASNTMET
jgi:SulP family sulfate permease